MRLATPICMVGFGLVLGVTLVLSCGDDSPKKVDAADAMCTCPAAEPPIPDRVKEVKTNEVIPSHATHVIHSAACPPIPAQGLVLNGGCTADLPALGSIVLEQSDPGANGWGCAWSNPSDVDVPVHVIVHCLMPAQ